MEETLEEKCERYEKALKAIADPYLYIRNRTKGAIKYTSAMQFAADPRNLMGLANMALDGEDIEWTDPE